MSGPADFIDLPAEVRRERLTVAISQCHAYHFERNVAYRATVSARGVGPALRPGDLAHILRPAALTFKSYAEVIGPFPQDNPAGFHRWLNDQLSCSLPGERWDAARRGRRYALLEALLCDLERGYSDLGRRSSPLPALRGGPALWCATRPRLRWPPKRSSQASAMYGASNAAQHSSF